MFNPNFDAMSLARRLSLGFISVLTLLLAVAVTSSYALKLQGERVLRIVQVNNMKTALANGLMESINDLAIRSRSVALFTDMDRKQLELELVAAKSARQSFMKTEGMLNAMLADEDSAGPERTLMRNIFAAGKIVFIETEESMKQALDADYVGAVLTLSNRVQPAELVLRAHVTALSDLQRRVNEEASTDTLARQHEVFAIVGLLVAVALGMGGVIAWRITRSVTIPITRMQRLMTEITTSQDFSRRVPVDRMDEIGLSLVAFNTMIEKIEQSSRLQHQAMALAEHMTMELRTSEQHQRAILENASIGIIFTSARTTEHSNSKAAALFGWASPEEMKGLPGSAYWPSEADYREVGRAASAGLAKGIVFETERPMCRKDGSTFLARVIAKAIDPDAASAGTIWIIEDVTEQRRVESLLQESERHLSQIIGGSPIAMFVINRQHRITHWNRACEYLTGVTAATVIGSTDTWRGFYEKRRPTMANLVLNGGDNEEIARYYGEGFALSQLIPGAVGAEDYFPNMLPSGRWLQFMAAPLRDSSGSVIGAIETLNDITERKTAEQLLMKHAGALQQSNAELGHAMQRLTQTQQELVRSEKLGALGAMVVGVAHEMNTPIGNCLMLASTLQDSSRALRDSLQTGMRRATLEQFVADSLEGSQMLMDGLTRVARLVSSFKRLAVSRSDKLRGEFDLAEVVAVAINTVVSNRDTNGIVIEQNVASGIILNSFPSEMEQILNSLIDNAITHGFDGRGQGHIEISASVDAADGTVTLKVTDDGNGIAAEILSRIFDPFFTTKLGVGDSGLGLNITYNQVTGILGGRIDVHSTLGLGTCFSLILPLQAPPKSESL